MKILALRLENLASLAGPQTIDFESGALADAGLFAITGPTGAGKSTLLDACASRFMAPRPACVRHPVAASWTMSVTRA